MDERSVIVTETEHWAELALNRPRKLNVLNDEVIGDLKKSLSEVASNDAYKMVFLSGRGPKGFCAGGDVVSVLHYQGHLPQGHFFNLEYEVDLMVHRFPKPIIALCHGVTMGGGVGLTNGCRLNVYDPKTLFAMPEITIGLFPDVGASYFLNKLDRKWCLFLAMTGARIDAHLAQTLGLCDYIVEQSLWPQLKESTSYDDLKSKCEQLCCGIPAHLEDFSDLDCIDQMTSVDEFDTWARNYSDQGHSWISTSLKSYLQGSPLSAKVIWAYFHWAKGKSLEECFQMDYRLCCLMLDHSDFREGVRALLIDKDKKPVWMFKDLNSISDEIWSKYEDLFN